MQNLLANCFVESLNVLSFGNLSSCQQNHNVIQRCAHVISRALAHFRLKILKASAGCAAWAYKGLTCADSLVGCHHILERLSDHELFLLCALIGQ